jgi:hypothetical protein
LVGIARAGVKVGIPEGPRVTIANDKYDIKPAVPVKQVHDLCVKVAEGFVFKVPRMPFREILFCWSLLIVLIACLVSKPTSRLENSTLKAFSSRFL